MSRYNASELTYDEITILDQPALFSEKRINRATVPEDLYFYEIRHSDSDWGKPIELARGIMVNFYGTVLTREPFQLPIRGWLELKEDSFVRRENSSNTIAGFQEKYPVSDKEVIDFFTVNDRSIHDLYFSQSKERDKVTGCIGHLLGDFGNGKEFFTSWRPHQNGELNTPDFKADIDRTINWLRKQPDSPLRDLETMRHCYDLYKQTCPIEQAMSPSAGFMVKTKQYVYMLRCCPEKSEYNLHMYCYQREKFERSRIQPVRMADQLAAAQEQANSQKESCQEQNERSDR